MAQIQGRVMIDVHAYGKFNGSTCFSGKPLSQYQEDDFGKLLGAQWRRLNADRERLAKEGQETNKRIVCQDIENLFIMCPYIDGYCLVSKRWRK